jgi:hypothetical protein
MAPGGRERRGFTVVARGSGKQRRKGTDLRRPNLTVRTGESTGRQDKTKGHAPNTKEKARATECPGFFSSVEPKLVDVVLLPVERGVGLDDDVFVSGLLEFVHEHGLAGL